MTHFHYEGMDVYSPGIAALKKPKDVDFFAWDCECGAHNVEYFPPRKTKHTSKLISVSVGVGACLEAITLVGIGV